MESMKELEAAPCRLCLQLQEAVESARQSGSPDLLLGLTEAGKRNRLHQREEKLARAELALEKHNKAHQNAIVAS